MRLPEQDSPFFTVKLNVKVLPCVVLFSGGVAVDRTVGFDEFGAKDDFSTGASLTMHMPCLRCSATSPLFSTAYLGFGGFETKAILL